MRVYIKAGQVIGSDGYTDVKVKKNGTLELVSTEGAELDFYDEENDKHYPVKYDMEGTGKTNPNFCKLYYEKDEDKRGMFYPALG